MPQAQGEVINLLAARPDVQRAFQFGMPVVRQSVSQAFASVGAATTAEQTVVVNGVEVGDWVSVVKPTLQAGLAAVQARVTAKNTIAITFVNASAGGITPTTEVYQVLHGRILVTV